MYGSYYYSSYRFDPTTIVIPTLIALLVSIIALWRVFTKAGEKGWKSLIPIYNSFVLWDIGWDSSKFLTLFLGGLIFSLVNTILGFAGRVGVLIGGVLVICWGIYGIVMTFKWAIRMAHRFGKSTAFGVVGLVFFAPIGMLILAFGSADYRAARDVGDGILRPDAEIDRAEDRANEYWDRFKK